MSVRKHFVLITILFAGMFVVGFAVPAIAISYRCFDCGNVVRSTCPDFSGKIAGQCIFMGNQWNCVVTSYDKRRCYLQLDSTCTVTSGCAGICEHTFGTGTCWRAGGWRGCVD
jgi:hypothetical protein